MDRLTNYEKIARSALVPFITRRACAQSWSAYPALCWYGRKRRWGTSRVEKLTSSDTRHTEKVQLYTRASGWHEATIFFLFPLQRKAAILIHVGVVQEVGRWGGKRIGGWTLSRRWGHGQPETPSLSIGMSTQHRGPCRVGVFLGHVITDPRAIYYMGTFSTHVSRCQKTNIKKRPPPGCSRWLTRR